MEVTHSMIPLDPRQDTHGHWLTFEDCYSWGRVFQHLIPSETNDERRDLFILVSFCFLTLGLSIKQLEEPIPLMRRPTFLHQDDLSRVQHMMRWTRGPG